MYIWTDYMLNPKQWGGGGKQAQSRESIVVCFITLFTKKKKITYKGYFLKLENILQLKIQFSIQHLYIGQ